MLCTRTSLHCRREIKHRGSLWRQRSPVQQRATNSLSTTCTYDNSSHDRLLQSSSSWLPRHSFATSRFNTLVLLFLRLFYQASPFQTSSIVANSVDRLPSQRLVDDNNLVPAVGQTEALPLREKATPSNFLTTYARISTKDWLSAVMSSHQASSQFQVVSLTWVKALASPLSHEYIQAVIEDVQTQKRIRIAVGREDSGDWVVCGWNWKSGLVPSHHHSLPLPLLSLRFPPGSPKIPKLVALSDILATVTDQCPRYNLNREMCWWYSEQVFQRLYSHYGGEVKEWQWSKYRYSFIVKTNVIRRDVLTEHAQEFRRQIINEMEF